MYPFGHMVSDTSSMVTRCGRTAALEKRRELRLSECIAADRESIERRLASRLDLAL